MRTMSTSIGGLMEVFKFEDSTKSVFKWNEELQTYIYIGPYISFGIKKNMTLKEKKRHIEKYEYIGDWI